MFDILSIFELVFSLSFLYPFLKDVFYLVLQFSGIIWGNFHDHYPCDTGGLSVFNQSYCFQFQELP